VKCADDTQWHKGQVINLSVTGVLLQTDRKYRVGERVEVEIDFQTQPQGKTVVSGVGLVVRTDAQTPSRAAVHFVVECGLARRSESGTQEKARPS
jgi:Tfp pilus assembly protein PilZ